MVTEALESGRGDLARPDGTLRTGLRRILTATDPERLMFETPATPLQVEVIARPGPDANLGNIAVDAVVSVETPRPGLRGDTLARFA